MALTGLGARTVNGSGIFGGPGGSGFNPGQQRLPPQVRPQVSPVRPGSQAAFAMNPLPPIQPHITTGITTDPVVNQQQLASMSQGIGQFAGAVNANNPLGGGNPALAQLMQDNTSGMVRSGQVGLDRMAAKANASQVLNAEQARASSGAGFLGHAVGRRGRALQDQQNQQSQLLQMLGLLAGETG